MSAAAEDLLVASIATRRRAPRYALDVPVEVTALRSGIPYQIPGRSLDAGEHGLSMVLAGELRVGESVGVQLRLPQIGGPLYLKAIVRHHAALQCGLEFQSLAVQEQAKLRYWTQSNSAAGREAQLPLFGAYWPTPPPAAAPQVRKPVAKPHRGNALVHGACIALIVFLAIGGLGWWHWYRSWGELESGIGSESQTYESVPGEIMERLMTYKVAPIYPQGAKQPRTQGEVQLDAEIGTDGSVVDVRPIGGPDELAPAAVEAAKAWRFRPYRVNGRAVAVETTLTVNFGAR